MDNSSFERLGGINELPYIEGGDPAKYSDVRPELVDTFKEQAKEQPLLPKIKTFSRFLQKYTDDLSAQSAPILSQFHREVSRPEQYINSFNIIFGAVIEGLSPDNDFAKRFSEGAEIDEMMDQVYKLAPASSRDLDEITTVGQRLKAVQFYADAKRDFFPELFAEQE